MPVFFVHDPAQGIVTPLDRKFRTREIEAPEKASATGRVHARTGDESPDRVGAAMHAPRQQTEDLNVGPLQVKDIMSKPAMCSRIEHSLLQAWQTLQKYEIHHLAIVDDNMSLKGIFSSHQLLEFLITSDHLKPELSLAQTTLIEFCGETVLSTHPDALVSDLASALLELGLDGVPVCQQGHLIGMVTYSDIVKTLLKDSSITADV